MRVVKGPQAKENKNGNGMDCFSLKAVLGVLSVYFETVYAFGIDFFFPFSLLVNDLVIIW